MKGPRRGGSSIVEVVALDLRTSVVPGPFEPGHPLKGVRAVHEPNSEIVGARFRNCRFSSPPFPSNLWTTRVSVARDARDSGVPVAESP
jgi:hypothetical protein